MFAAGLSWIGIEPKNVVGRAGQLLQLSTLIAGFALLEGEWHEGPWAYRLRHVGRGLSARVNDFDLWDEHWGDRPSG